VTEDLTPLESKNKQIEIVELTELRAFIERLFEQRKIWVLSVIVENLRRSGAKVSSVYTIKR